MVPFDYLHKGLCGMANAPRANSMAGHLGAAVVAGYFIGEDHPGTEPDVFAAIERDLNRITGGEESIWFDPKKAGITAEALFETLPDGPAQPKGIGAIADALKKNIGSMRQSGHNVIFASIAIRALRGHADLATSPMIAGLKKLITLFDGQHPGRGYFGKDRGWITGDKLPPDELPDAAEYTSLENVAQTVVEQLIATASQRRRGFGGLFHLINHAAALTELHSLGFPDLATAGLEGHRHHLRLYRSLPDLEAELGKLEKTADDPFKVPYWKRTESKQWGAWLTHRIKTLYGFHTLLRFVDDEAKRAKALKEFGYLLA